jgi:Heterokaryon incompatibility protein (HET)
MSYLPRLDPSERQIRLLILTSSTSTEELQCELRTVSPTSSPNYTALSYVWGDETTRCKIDINGETTSITTNLDIALRNFWQKEGGEVAIWADAICINQADDLE